MEPFSWPESMLQGRKEAIDELVKGREATNTLISLLATNNLSSSTGGSVPMEPLATQILNSFANTLSILNACPIGGGPSDDYSDEVSNVPASRKSEDSGESSKSTHHQLPALQSRRGFYKRRKTVHTWTKDTDTLVDDGHGWRKYGQKVILNAKNPRSYFRCTHKFDQHCQATKQVQKLDVEPTVYRTTYLGYHTCTDPLRASQLLVDHTDSSELISFSAAAATNMNATAGMLHHPHPFFNVKQEEFHAAPAANTTSRTENVAAGQSPSCHNYYMPHDDTFDQVSGDVMSSSCTTTSANDSFNCLDNHLVIGDLDDDVLQLIHFS